MIDNLQSFLSGLADNYRTSEIDKRELEHRLLELIADEIDNNTVDRATWLKAFSEAEADERRSKALYIKYRRERLMDQIVTLEIKTKQAHQWRQQGTKDTGRTGQNSSQPRTQKELDMETLRVLAGILLFMGLLLAIFLSFG